MHLLCRMLLWIQPHSCISHLQGWWSQCNHVKQVFGNSYSGPVTISPVTDLLFISKCTTFSSNRTKCGATIWREEPADVQVMLWELEEHALITWGSVMVGAGVRALSLELIGYLLHRCTAAVQRRRFLGPTRPTSRACLRRDRGASETVWQIWAWPPWRERKGANWIYIFVFNPPYTPHWLYSSSECMSARMGTEEMLKI